MPDLPTGTVTFLASDIGGGTDVGRRHLRQQRALAKHHAAILGDAVAAHGGAPFQEIGALQYAAFPVASEALAAILDGRRASTASPADDDFEAGIRSALHTGEAAVRDGRYVSTSLRRVAQLLAAAHGGQVLLSSTTAELVRRHLPAGVHLRDLGEHRFSDLAPPEHIFQLDVADTPVDFPPIRTLDWHPHNLPAQLAPLIGREEDVSAVDHLLRQAEVRLVTLTGPGGIGKTRLAQHVAASLVDAYDDGVFFVSLASIDEPGLVVSTIAQTLDVTIPEGQGPREALFGYLSDRQMLLVLDNFEHVIEAAIDVAALLASCLRMKVLATSRETLNVRGEHTYAVPPMTLPEPGQPVTPGRLTDYDAVRLFIARATEANPRFAFDDELGTMVVDICRRLDGLPLAIELAAARSAIFTPPQLATRLARRLPLLTGGPRDLPPRQRTLRDTIAWSHDLLSVEEQTLFRHLSLFAGGFDLEAAEYVGSRGEMTGGKGNEGTVLSSSHSVLDGLAALVHKSLLHLERPDVDGTLGPRFRMLETIREYGLEQLAASGDAPATRRRHAEWFLALAERAHPELIGPDQLAWLRRLDADLDNLRSALGWSIQQGDAETALRLGSALWRYWARRGLLGEGRTWLERALAIGNAVAPAVRARALNDLGNLANELDDYPRARALYEESLRLRREIGDQSAIAYSLLNLGVVARYQADYDEARRLGEEALAIHQALRDELGTGYCQSLLGDVAASEGDTAKAWKLHEQVLALRRARGDAVGVAYSQWRLGEIAANRGDRERARDLLQQCLAAFRKVGEKLGIAYALQGLAAVAFDDRGLREAASLYDEALTIWREAGRRLGVVECLEGLAGVAGASGHEVTAQLVGVATAWRVALGTPLAPVDRPRIEHAAAGARAALGPGRFEAARATGESMALDEVVEVVAKVVEVAEQAAGKPEPRRRAGALELTPRELDVLRLIAANKTNAEIADDLFIRHRTVTTHVDNIFNKLGINSRVAAAVYAIQQGLA